MSGEEAESLRKTIEAQAERIRMLERQLDARANASDAATLELAALKKRAAISAPPASPNLSPRQRIRKAIVLVGGRLLPRPMKRFIKKFWDPWRVPRRVRPQQTSGRSATPVPSATTFDVVCFSIIDWSFRWQRPQQLLSQFADAGHRVFVLNTSAFLSRGLVDYEITPLRDNVWEVTLAPPVMIDVYGGVIDTATIVWFPSMLEQIRRDLNIVAAVSLVQVATWREVAAEARRRFGWRLIYDCMDEWTSFPGMKPELLAAEERLVAEADLVTVSAGRLLDKWRGANENVRLVRNAADFAHFSAPPNAEPVLADVRHPIVGYFGALASWFDVALVARVAAERPQYSFVLIGGVFDIDVEPLKRLPNVHLLGQQRYTLMPAYLREFDACLIPFVISDITAATDPVKFYEYISLGKPVVSTFMPELEPFEDLLYHSKDGQDFLQKVDLAVAEDDELLRERRIQAARENTWPLRANAMLRAIADAHPKVSIVIVSWENCQLTRQCLESVLQKSVHPNLEVIVVDNGSKDGSVEMLAGLSDERVRVLFNRENAGFAAANNQALRVATGSYVVLLNNDTVVPRGWLPRLLRHVDDPAIGLVVAVTNFSGNESRIDVPYDSIADMSQFAERYMHDHDGEHFDIRVAAMYCVAMRRDVYDRVGPLDEQFVIGMFEDDDYSHRVRLAGFRVVCAEDAFVHHIGQASFSKLDAQAYDLLWKRNQAAFEKKWGVPWQPHRARS
jgi:GT2 family glycosyltransferase/glycosyltransferase involved in cell wall biosynthesis